MDTLKKIERLFQRAAQKPTPVFRVSDQVLWRLKQKGQPETYWTFDVFAAISVVAASVVLFWAISAWLSMNDPMNQLVEPLQEAVLW